MTARERLRIAIDNEAVARELARVEGILVEEGRDPPLRAIRARSAAAQAAAEVAAARAEEQAARGTLASLFGVTDPPESVAGSLLDLQPVTVDPEQSLDVRLAEAERLRAEAGVRPRSRARQARPGGRARRSPRPRERRRRPGRRRLDSLPRLRPEPGQYRRGARRCPSRRSATVRASPRPCACARATRSSPWRRRRRGCEALDRPPSPRAPRRCASPRISYREGRASMLELLDAQNAYRAASPRWPRPASPWPSRPPSSAASPHNKELAMKLITVIIEDRRKLLAGRRGRCRRRAGGVLIGRSMAPQAADVAVRHSAEEGMRKGRARPGRVREMTPARLQASGVRMTRIEAGSLARRSSPRRRSPRRPKGQALLTARADGAVVRINKRLGDPVGAGETVALLESREAAALSPSATRPSRAGRARPMPLGRGKSGCSGAGHFARRISRRRGPPRTRPRPSSRAPRSAVQTAGVTGNGRYLAVSSPISAADHRGRHPARRLCLGGRRAVQRRRSAPGPDRRRRARRGRAADPARRPGRGGAARRRHGGCGRPLVDTGPQPRRAAPRPSFSSRWARRQG